MKTNNEIIPCVILAGGKGRRMGGKEKALINLLDRPLISYVLEKVSGKAAPIALNINSNYEKFQNFGYEILEDPLKGHLGPLVGQLMDLSVLLVDLQEFRNQSFEIFHNWNLYLMQ